METRDGNEVLCEVLDVAGKDVIEIGCGEGHQVRAMARNGAKVIGVDFSAKQLEKARAVEPAGNETYAEGKGEDLPYDDSAFDAVIYFNTLHHIDPDKMESALIEAARIVKPGGVVYIAEPLAEGGQFDLTKSFNDETVVRRKAYEAIKAVVAAGTDLHEEQEIHYDGRQRHKSFEDFKARMFRINPSKEAGFAEHEAEVRGLYERLAVRVDDVDEFSQPIRVSLLRKKS